MARGRKPSSQEAKAEVQARRLVTKRLRKRRSYDVEAREALEAREAGLLKPTWPKSPRHAPLPRGDAEWRDLLCSLPRYDPYLLAGDCHFDVKRAVHAIAFIECRLRFTEGVKAGQKLRLERWQRAFVANLFGWVRPDGRRRFTNALLYIPTGNGKSTLSAAIANLVFDDETDASAQVIMAGTKRDQAKIVWKAAAQMLERRRRRERRERFRVGVARVVRSDGGEMFPVSADASAEDGLAASCILFDELHRQDDTDLLNVLAKSMGKRWQPLFIRMTTADVDRPSPCNDELAYARAIRDNPGDSTRPGFNPYYLPAIYEADEKCDVSDERVWALVNPGLGVSKSLDTMREQFVEARAKGGIELASWMRYHLNLRTKAARSLFPMGAWDACGERFDVSILNGCEVYVGIDLSSTTDVTAVVIVASLRGLLYLVPRFWVPRAAVKGRDRQNDPLYRTWEQQGLLTVTDGDQLDDQRILEEIGPMLAPFRVKEVCIDPWNSLRYTQPLMAKGYNVVQVRQGTFTQNEPMKHLLQLVGKGTVRHGGHPVLRWMADNARAQEDRKGNWTLVKDRAQDKVDGIAATVTALARMIAETKPVGSVYETRGIRIL